MGTENSDSVNSSTQTRDYKSILADHLGKALATIMIAGASTYFGIQYQNSEKMSDTVSDQKMEQSSNYSSEKPNDKNLRSKKQSLLKTHSKLKILEKLPAEHRMGAEKIITQKLSGERLIVIYKNTEKINLKSGDFIEVGGIENMSPLYKETVIVVDLNESGSYLKKM